MNAPAENTAPCALVLGTLFLEKPSSSTAKLLLEGLASADLPAEWPYGDKATKRPWRESASSSDEL